MFNIIVFFCRAIGNATPAILIVFLMFIVPANPNIWPFRSGRL